MSEPIYTSMQQVFDKVCERLADGRGRAFDPKESQCLYRTSEGVPCAVGCLIPDEYFEPEYNKGVGVLTLARASEKFVSLFSESLIPPRQPIMGANNGLIDLLAALQGIHDKGENWYNNQFVRWGAIKTVAHQFGLELKVEYL